jgi:hypothetical protein
LLALIQLAGFVVVMGEVVPIAISRCVGFLQVGKMSAIDNAIS